MIKFEETPVENECYVSIKRNKKCHAWLTCTVKSNVSCFYLLLLYYFIFIWIKKKNVCHICWTFSHKSDNKTDFLAFLIFRFPSSNFVSWSVLHSMSKKKFDALSSKNPVVFVLFNMWVCVYWETACAGLLMHVFVLQILWLASPYSTSLGFFSHQELKHIVNATVEYNRSVPVPSSVCIISVST